MRRPRPTRIVPIAIMLICLLTLGALPQVAAHGDDRAPPPPANEPPFINITSHPANGFDTESDTVILAGNVTDDVGVESVTVALDGGEPEEALLMADGWMIVLTDLAVGTHALTITACDGEGAITELSLAFEVVEPVNLPPVIEGINVPVSGHTIEEGTRLNLTGRVVDATGMEWVRIKVGSTMQVPAILEGEDWWYVLPALLPGEYMITVLARDAKGLESNVTIPLTVTRVAGEPTEDEETENRAAQYASIGLVAVGGAAILVALLLTRFRRRRISTLPPARTQTRRPARRETQESASQPTYEPPRPQAWESASPPAYEPPVQQAWESASPPAYEPPVQQAWESASPPVQEPSGPQAWEPASPPAQEPASKPTGDFGDWEEYD